MTSAGERHFLGCLRLTANNLLLYAGDLALLFFFFFMSVFVSYLVVDFLNGRNGDLLEEHIPHAI